MSIIEMCSQFSFLFISFEKQINAIRVVTNFHS